MAIVPPLDLVTARDNPKFEALYRGLTTSILNSDGSVKVSSQRAREQESVRDEVLAAQHAAAKTTILRAALAQLYQHDLPDELQDLITLIVSPPVDQDQSRLGNFLSNRAADPSHLAPLVSEELSSTSHELLHLASLEPNQASTVHQIAVRKNELGKSKARLHNERLGLTSAACSVLETQQETFTRSIQALESVKCGSVARASVAEAGNLIAAAEELDEKLRALKLEALQSIYNPEVRVAIESYRKHLAQVKVRLMARERSTKEKLGQYKALGQNVGEIANGYDELVQEVEKVKAEINKLDSKDNS